MLKASVAAEEPGRRQHTGISTPGSQGPGRWIKFVPRAGVGQEKSRLLLMETDVCGVSVNKHEGPKEKELDGIDYVK